MIPEVYCPDPGTVESADCGICETKMDVTRDAYGPTSSLMGMAGRKRKHDFFHCPHRKEKWHIQVKQLKEAARKTPSKTFEDIYLTEVAEILKTRQPSKEVSIC